MIFLTWKCWQYVQFPMRQHPIFQYGRQSSRIPMTINYMVKRVIQAMLAVIAILFVIVLPIPTLITTVSLTVALPILLILFNGTVLGSIWVTNISAIVSKTRYATQYELLQLTPLGGLGASWLLAIGIVHRHDWLKRVYKIIKWVLFVILVLLALSTILLIVGLLTTDNTQLQQQQINVLRDVITLTIIMIALWLDHIQSILVAIFLGIVLPTLLPDRVYVRALSPILYLVLQTITYLISGILYVLIDIILTGLLGTTFISHIAILMLTIVSFYLIRECLLMILLQVILVKYDTLMTDFQQLIPIIN
jgi:hypothetical protein